MDEENVDEVIEEIHRIRKAISVRFNGDIDAIVADAARRQAQENRPVWSPHAPSTLPLPINVNIPASAPQEHQGQ